MNDNYILTVKQLNVVQLLIYLYWNTDQIYFDGIRTLQSACKNTYCSQNERCYLQDARIELLEYINTYEISYNTLLKKYKSNFKYKY